MKYFKLSVCALALAAAASVPGAAAARTYYQHHYTHHRHYVAPARHDSGCHQRHSTNGTIIGAIGGGLVGNAVSHGNRLPGTALGAGVGALAGHAVGARSGC